MDVNAYPVIQRDIWFHVVVLDCNMQCISPIYLNRNGERQFVACGKCMFCLERRRSDWSFRLEQELKNSLSGHFITLTYDDAFLPKNKGTSTLVKRDLQLFIKKLRISQDRYYEREKLNLPKIKYYACGEYGTLYGRPHYHIIAFNLSLYISERIESIWQHGNVKVANCNGATIHYTTKYVINKFDIRGDCIQPFALMSKHLGESYIENNYEYHRKNGKFYSNSGNVRHALPRYYTERIFTKLESAVNAKRVSKDLDKNYVDEVKNASKHHKNPDLYIAEKIRFKHDHIKNKVNKNNQL